MTLQQLLALLCAVNGMMLGGVLGGSCGWFVGLLAALAGALLGWAGGHAQQACSNWLDGLARRVSRRNRPTGFMLHAADIMLTLAFLGLFVAAGVFASVRLVRRILPPV